jgi:hypothetical protein
LKERKDWCVCVCVRLSKQWSKGRKVVTYSTACALFEYSPSNGCMVVGSFTRHPRKPAPSIDAHRGLVAERRERESSGIWTQHGGHHQIEREKEGAKSGNS